MKIDEQFQAIFQDFKSPSTDGIKMYYQTYTAATGYNTPV